MGLRSDIQSFPGEIYKIKMFYYTYLTTNKLNGKQYIGSHKGLLENDNYIGSGSLILKAIKKYGFFNFDKKILKYYDNIDKARSMEEHYITKYNTLVPNGYNISPTGCTSNGGHSEETIERIKKNNIGKHDHIGPWAGLSRSKETKKKISESLKGQESPMKGKKHTKEAKDKMSKNRSGISSWSGKKHSRDSKEKISNSLKGRKLSEETKKKMSKVRKKYWASKNKKQV